MTRFTTPRATNFYYSFVLLSPEKRRAIEAVYAFARRGDDLADNGLAPDEARQRLARYRSALDQCYNRVACLQANASPLVQPPGELSRVRFEEQAGVEALAEAVERFKIPRQPFDDLIRGFEMDLGRTSYRTFNDLALYCYRVASTIGLISIEIFGYSNPQARQYAVDLGMALQLVNILRDLQSDARSGRVYLPQEDLEGFGVSADDLRTGRLTGATLELVRFECARARHYFELARHALPPGDRHSLIAAEVMGATYWELLRRIERRGYNVFGARVGIPRPLRLWIALRVYLGKDWHR